MPKSKSYYKQVVNESTGYLPNVVKYFSHFFQNEKKLDE